MCMNSMSKTFPANHCSCLALHKQITNGVNTNRPCAFLCYISLPSRQSGCGIINLLMIKAIWMEAQKTLIFVPDLKSLNQKGTPY